MIKVSVFYPYSEGAAFDMDYYVSKHIPMVAELTGAACKGASVDAGLASGAPGEQARYVAIGHLLFDSVEDFQTAFGPHADKIMGDIPNYTKITPTIQISNVIPVAG
jgi:uncharacterized protein (TIGR02118 family)